jgi:hypothetical protein
MVTPNIENARDDGYMAFQEGYSKTMNPWAQDGEDWGFHLAWQAGWEVAAVQEHNWQTQFEERPLESCACSGNYECAFHMACGCQYGEGPCGKHR